MAKFNQKEGVFSVICELFGVPTGHFQPSKEQRKEIVAIVADNIMDGTIEFSAEAREKHNTLEKVTKYTDGMVNNWLRKDIRLNGGTKYVTKNPGSRAGQGDTTLTELKKLKTTLTDKDQLAAVDQAIEERRAELGAEKAKTVEVDMTKIPEALRKQLNLG